MKIVRYYTKGKDKPQFGIQRANKVFELIGSPYENFMIDSSHPIRLHACKLTSPCGPSKIILVGLNYRKHAKELRMRLPKEPIIFMKPSVSVIGHRDHIVYPKKVKRLDYEAELAVVIKKKCRNAPMDAIDDFILGYTCLNDVTARDLQKKDGQWTRAKSFDTFCPIGPCIATDIDPGHLSIRLYLNNKIMQSSNTNDQIFSVKKTVSFISGIMTLLPGDVVSTGTPSGVGPMKKGDIVKVQIDKIGTLENRVA